LERSLDLDLDLCEYLVLGEVLERIWFLERFWRGFGPWRGLGEDLVSGEVLERIWFPERSLDLDLGESLERSLDLDLDL